MNIINQILIHITVRLLHCVRFDSPHNTQLLRDRRENIRRLSQCR